MQRASNDSIAYNVKGLCEVYLEKYKDDFANAIKIIIKIGDETIQCNPSDFIPSMTNVFLDDRLLKKTNTIQFETENKVLDTIYINH